MIKLLSQRDPEWAYVQIGSSPMTLGRWGCTVTSLSMLSEYFGCFVPPNKIANHVDWFTNDGLVLWKSLKFDRMAFYSRQKGRDDQMIQEALLNPKKGVLLQVNNCSHWVLALRKTRMPLSFSYVVADPWDGKKCDVIEKYHNITGAAYFVKK